jgi:hypothetical protein
MDDQLKLLEEKFKLLERRATVLERKIHNQSIVIAKLERENARRKTDIQILAARKSR